jgi:hypothetical protein
MTNNAVAFEFLPSGQQAPIGYKKIPLHIVFDVQMDFTRKACLVAGGHLTKVPQHLTYSSDVSRDTVCVIFLIATLNDLNILSADIGNAYLNAPNREKVYSITGPEFGSRIGETVIITQALYDLKSAGAVWRSHLANSLVSLGYKSCLADPDLWIRDTTKGDSTKYYEYLTIYVDDILCISEHPELTMNEMAKLYHLKDNTVGKPTTYLVAIVVEYILPDDRSKICWGFSSHKYATEVVWTVELELSKVNTSLSQSVMTRFSSGYCPELDISPLLPPAKATYFQNLIGILRWSIELGRLDIHAHVAMLSSFLAAPRERHLAEALHIFAYLKC